MTTRAIPLGELIEYLQEADLSGSLRARLGQRFARHPAVIARQLRLSGLTIMQLKDRERKRRILLCTAQGLPEHIMATRINAPSVDSARIMVRRLTGRDYAELSCVGHRTDS